MVNNVLENIYYVVATVLGIVSIFEIIKGMQKTNTNETKIEFANSNTNSNIMIGNGNSMNIQNNNLDNSIHTNYYLQPQSQDDYSWFIYVIVCSFLYTAYTAFKQNQIIFFVSVFIFIILRFLIFVIVAKDKFPKKKSIIFLSIDIVTYILWVIYHSINKHLFFNDIYTVCGLIFILIASIIGIITILLQKLTDRYSTNIPFINKMNIGYKKYNVISIGSSFFYLIFLFLGFSNLN